MDTLALWYSLLKKNAFWWLDNGYKYLQFYCVAEIIILICAGALFLKQWLFITEIWREASLEQLGIFCPFLYATWKIIEKMIDSINMDQGKNAPPPLPSTE